VPIVRGAGAVVVVGALVLAELLVEVLKVGVKEEAEVHDFDDDDAHDAASYRSKMLRGSVPMRECMH